jgi:hypothetical protein
MLQACTSCGVSVGFEPERAAFVSALLQSRKTLLASLLEES